MRDPLDSRRRRAGLVQEPLYRYRVQGKTLTSDRVATRRDRVFFLERIKNSYDLGESEAAALRRSLAAQRSALVLTEAEAALRSRAPDARGRALAVARGSGVSLRQRAAAVMATLAPRTAGRLLDRRERKTGYSRLGALPAAVRPGRPGTSLGARIRERPARDDMPAQRPPQPSGARQALCAVAQVRAPACRHRTVPLASSTARVAFRPDRCRRNSAPRVVPG